MHTELPLVVRAIATGVRPVRLRLPFRFGAVTLTGCPQLFIRATVEVGGTRRGVGIAAELMVPKWFDKRAELSHADNVTQLAVSAQIAVQAYLNDAPARPFELFARHYPALMQQGHEQGFTDLTSAYGQAVLDRAVLDAFCRALDLSFFEVAGHNLLGLQDCALLPDLQGFDWDKWLKRLRPLRSVQARHTVGMLDELSATHEADDDLPASLPAVIRRYGNRVFKIKLGGEPAADVARLAEVLQVLDERAPGHRYTLDGNEQYADAAALSALFARLAALPAFAQRPDALLYIEQPVPRDQSLQHALPAAQAPAPLLMDEADGTLDAFMRGRDLGWRGVSSKGCKGLYKALANRARCERWNLDAERDNEPAGFFMSAEDLTCQAGVSVQQDLAQLALLGLSHSERNGHHYADGFGTAPQDEQRAFAMAHRDLYESTAGHPRLAIVDGRISFDSLFKPGFARRCDVDWHTMKPLADAATMV
ncbi:MAG TPA: enolase C-terminal domain-like protein [Albitalea sp.]|nr:enolase C-terminal domain-like protein [Albitalea sp.]